MAKKTFSKLLSANDVGTTGGHQAGIHIPKTEKELLEFLPPLDESIKNPDAWLECVDEDGVVRRFRYIYYNNKFHDPKGTRNEYRLTHMTSYFRDVGACEGDAFEISKDGSDQRYYVRIVHRSVERKVAETPELYRIKIKSAWRRVH